MAGGVCPHALSGCGSQPVPAVSRSASAASAGFLSLSHERWGEEVRGGRRKPLRMSRLGERRGSRADGRTTAGLRRKRARPKRRPLAGGRPALRCPVVGAWNRAILRQERQKPVTGTGVSEKGGCPELIE